MKSRIMYIEQKPDGVNGPARIGRVTFSKSGRSLSCLHNPPTCHSERSRPISSSRLALARRSACGCEESLFSVAQHSSHERWPRSSATFGGDRLYPGSIEIDPDVREEYWKEIRALPDKIDQATFKCPGKYGGKPK